MKVPRTILILAALLVLTAMRPAAALEARVVDAVTGKAIPQATIVVGGLRLLTNANGAFSTDQPGDRIFARAPGYRAASFERAGIGAELRLQPFEPRGLYLTVYGIGSQSIRGSALALIQDKAANALVIDVKGDRGIVPYPSAVALANQDGARKFTSITDLAGLVAMLHGKGIYAIARIVTFKDDPLASQRPDLAVHRLDGSLFRDREGLAWTDPFRKEVRDYNIAIAVEAARAGFDEIQFDYLRFPDAPQRLQFALPANRASRLAAISALLTEARQALLPYNVYLGADIFGYVCWNADDTGIGQRLEQIAPNVDYLSPMLYPSGFQAGIPGFRNPVQHPYEIVYWSLKTAQQRLGISPKRFRPWLQAFKDYAFDRRAFAANEIALQIHAAADFGSDGWMLWNPRNNYQGTGLVIANAQTRQLQVAQLSASSSCF